MKYLDKILASKKTVFSYEDMRIILWIANKNTLKKIFERACKNNIFQKIYRWIYTLKNYDTKELAVKIKKNSYISFETVLKEQWVIFQNYGNKIFLASDNSGNKKVWDLEIIFLKVKNSILQNPIWLENKWNYIIANKERALCDRIYLTKNYYFDNLEDIDVEKLLNIAKIYNKRVILQVNKLIKHA